MKQTDFNNFITRNRQICNGEPIIKGTRITVRTILASLAEGSAIEEILQDFPTLSEEALMSVIAFAAASAEEDLPVSAAPAIV